LGIICDQAANYILSPSLANNIIWAEVRLIFEEKTWLILHYANPLIRFIGHCYKKSMKGTYMIGKLQQHKHLFPHLEPTTYQAHPHWQTNQWESHLNQLNKST
jgi:hypothetical protein